MSVDCFFFNNTATTEIYTLPLHDALPISHAPRPPATAAADAGRPAVGAGGGAGARDGRRAHPGAPAAGAAPPAGEGPGRQPQAGQRLRPALLVLRDPGVPRRVRLARPAGAARGG